MLAPKCMEVKTTLLLIIGLYLLEVFRWIWARLQQVSTEGTFIVDYFVPFTFSVYLGQ